ncbi:hypothetical protein QCA50_008433 [Cerrena zonata]|uniref:non-specific serine/threonine protein kinase n=1 Tax=Cerrena zonata TaxID=2478898 RepID=A0AAW0G403_9APHY
MIMADTTATETAQTEGESPEGSDKPPHGNHIEHSSSAKQVRSSSDKSTRTNGAVQRQSSSKSATPIPQTPNGNSHVPLPPPESNSFPKAPGTTRRDLEQLSQSTKAALANAPHIMHIAPSNTGSISPSTSGSRSPSEYESSSVPSTQPNSRAPSRPPSRPSSFSAGKSGGKVAEPPIALSRPSSRKDNVKTPSRTPSTGETSIRPKGPPSVHSDTSGKFTLKDLLNSAPKLGRKSSARSTGSSKKSDSERGGRSTGGESNASLLKKYGVCEKVAIGKGATSVVRLAHKWDRSEEKLYAVKEFRKRRKNETEKEYVKKLTAEFCISSTLHHINIVETVDLVQDENLHWCEVMEFCPGGDLYAAIKRGGMSPAEVECCFKQILTGVNYLHSQGVAHRDIKPENLFFDTKGHLKIGDYGASTVYRLPWEKTIHMSTGLCGSEPYIAPEQFIGKPYDARLVDIWACGVVYYCLHFQELPWTVAQPTDQLFAAYVSACQSPSAAQSACPPTINNLSPRACRPLIRKMLEPNPKMRASIEETIKHSWIESIDVCHSSPKPAHVHVYAQAMAQAQAGVN